ncbi:unnamed protein product [Leuciscus chuanchicus]
MPSPPNDGDDQGTSPMNIPPALSNQNGVKRKVHTKKKKKGFITANVAGTKYEIVRIVIEEMTFHKARDEDEMANLIWNDSAVQHEKIAELRNYQRINHFPGMGEICRKDCLARNMAKMIKSQPQEYSFIPKTWIFPAECTQFQNYVKELKRKRKQKTFIVKPANGAMGHGISLIRNCEKIPVQDHFIVQEYLDKPFLMEGYKFDLRFYILVTSCDPLRVFLYNDGLVRMGTEKYHTPNESNLNQLYMHLTNYSVNKHNENFERDETVDKGSKRSIGWFTEFLRTNDYDVAKFWGDVSINRAPSFGTDQKIDYDVKKGALLNALKLLNIRASDKRRNLAQQKAEAQRRLYGQGSTRKLTAGSSDWEKQRHLLERRREELEEDILDLLEQCELDDEKLLGKTSKQKGSKAQGETPLSKEQEAELMQQTLAALGEMRIRYPGKSEEEAEAVLDEIQNNWKYHKPKVASYWLVKLDATKQRKVLDIVRTNIRSVLQRIWSEPDVESLRLYHLFNRVFNRLLWSHGQGLWNCLSSSGRSSWESVFSKSSEVVTAHELRCCQRVVQLCRDCLLVVYKFVADSRGSLSGLSPDWDDTRYLLPVTSQFIIKWPSSSFGRSASSTRPRSVFTTRMGHF